MTSNLTYQHIQRKGQLVIFTNQLINMGKRTLAFLQSFTLFVVCLVFAYPVLWLVLIYIKRSLQKITMVDVNVANYQNLRKSYDRLHQANSSLQENVAILTNTRLPFKYLLRQFTEIRQLSNQQVTHLYQQFTQFDDGKQNGQFFQYQSEDTVWNNRCKAYDYLV